jgi:large subunit ribosomal protein L11
MSSKASAASNALSAPARSSLLKLFITTGQASPSPPIGPALGQKGVKAMDFCRQFNERSVKQFAPGMPLRCHITVNPDRSFSFVIRPPTTSFLIKRAAGIDRLSSKYKVAEMSVKVLYEIAKQKHEGDPMLRQLPLQSVFKCILGTAKTCGIVVI